MKLWRWDLILIFCLLFVACPLDDCDSTAGPSLTTTTTIEPEPPLPSRVDVRPDLYGIRGCTAFGAAALNEHELPAFISHVQAGGCDILRAGAQTDGWEGHDARYLTAGLRASAGATVFSVQWELDLKRFLDTTARMGIAVQLIPTFTHKHESFTRNMKIAKAVVAIQQAGGEDDPTPYRHIVWEAWNEVKHPITHKTNRDFGNIKKMLTYLKNATGLAVGTDYDVSGSRHEWVGEYPRSLLSFVDYVAFHPPRNDMSNGCEDIRPNYWELRKTVNRYAGKPVWIDEPMCFISDASIARYGINMPNGHYAYCGQKTEQKRKEHISSYMWDVEHAGGVWFSHASWLFECRRLGWLPQ